MILFLKWSIIFSGIFFKKPAKTIKSGDNFFKSCKILPELSSSLLNSSFSKLLILFLLKTPASGLLQYNFRTLAFDFLLKYK